MIESLLILAALGAMGVAAWFAYRAAGVDPIRAERDRLRTEVDNVRRENVQLSADLAAAKATTGANSESEEARFVAIAAKALEASQAQFMALANETFEKHKQAAQGGVKEVLAPAQEALAKLAGQVEHFEKSRIEDKSALNEQMRQISESLKETKNVTGKLAHALRQSPKARGRWGEHSLRNALEMGGLTPQIDFEEQTTVEGDSGKLRPDLLIKLPGGRTIVVDSKVAISAFLDAIDAPDENARELLMQKHATEMRAHMKGLTSKEYWKHFATADFVVMFVPGDNLVSSAFEYDASLQEDAFKQKVVIASPTMMVALARTVAYGWRQEQSAKNAQEIAELGRDLFRRMAVMVDHMGKVGDSIGRSVKTYNEMIGSVESRVLPQARKFKELGAGDAGIDIVSPAQIEAAPRLPPPPEQLELMPPPQSAKRGR
jgi:DNA recombination protein RmuC